MRIPEVTRTVTKSVITALAVNTDSKTVEEVVITLPRTYEGEEAILKYLSKNKASIADNLKVVSVSKIEVVEELRAMCEEDFIKYSHVLPPRGTKKDEEPEQQEQQEQQEHSRKKAKKN